MAAGREGLAAVVICSESGSKRFDSMHADNTILSLTVLTEDAGYVVQCMTLILFLYSPYLKKGLEGYAIGRQPRISLKTTFPSHVEVLEFKQSDRKWLETVAM